MLSSELIIVYVHTVNRNSSQYAHIFHAELHQIMSTITQL
jgi:hypothetical protein